MRFWINRLAVVEEHVHADDYWQVQEYQVSGISSFGRWIPFSQDLSRRLSPLSLSRLLPLVSIIEFVMLTVTKIEHMARFGNERKLTQQAICVFFPCSIVCHQRVLSMYHCHRLFSYTFLCSLLICHLYSAPSINWVFALAEERNENHDRNTDKL